MQFPCSNCPDVKKDYYGYMGICDECERIAEYDAYIEKKEFNKIMQKGKGRRKIESEDIS